MAPEQYINIWVERLTGDKERNYVERISEYVDREYDIEFSVLFAQIEEIVTEKLEESLQLLYYTFSWRPMLEIPNLNVTSKRTRLEDLSQETVDLGWAHGALITTFPGDTTMATVEQVRAFAQGGSARIQR